MFGTNTETSGILPAMWGVSRIELRTIVLILAFLLFQPSLLEGQSAPATVGVSSLGYGTGMLHPWLENPTVRAQGIDLDLRVRIERNQQAIIDGLRSRRLDIGLLDPVSFATLSRDIELIPIRFQAYPNSFNSDPVEYVLIAPITSLVFSLDQVRLHTVALVDPAVLPSASFAVASLFRNAALPVPQLRYLETHTNVLKGSAYHWNEVGLVPAPLLESSENHEFVRRVRVVARTIPLPSAVFVVRADGRSDLLNQISRASIWTEPPVAPDTWHQMKEWWERVDAP